MTIKLTEDQYLNATRKLHKAWGWQSLGLLWLTLSYLAGRAES